MIRLTVSVLSAIFSNNSVVAEIRMLPRLVGLQQSTDRTVVDVILQSKLEGRYKGGETRCEDADFRLILFLF